MNLNELASALNHYADDTGLVFVAHHNGRFDRGWEGSLNAQLNTQQTANLLKLARGNPTLADEVFGSIGLTLDAKNQTLKILKPGAVTLGQIDMFQLNTAVIEVAIKTGDPDKVRKALDTVAEERDPINMVYLDDMHLNPNLNYTQGGLDADKYIGKLFVNGDYKLPPTLKIAALGSADKLMAACAARAEDITKTLPGVDINHDGKTTREEVASYMLAQSMDTSKPGMAAPGTVASRFTGDVHLDAKGPIVALVAQQIFGDNFDLSMRTNTPAADAIFTSIVDSSLPSVRGMK